MLRGVNTWADELCLGGREAGVISMPVNLFVRLMDWLVSSCMCCSLGLFILLVQTKKRT